MSDRNMPTLTFAGDYAGMLLLDRMNEGLETSDPLHAFALDELLCRQAGEGGPPICHLWRHSRAFILGQRDARLPSAAAALRQLEAQRYRTAVRSSGGAAVPLDAGVVNVSLILPIVSGQAGARFNGDFERMYELIAAALADTGVRVDKGEIAGAYCPGDYDLSIGGRKFCGIAQRRQAKALIVQAFVVAEGSGSERAALVRRFYDDAAGGAGSSAGGSAGGAGDSGGSARNERGSGASDSDRVAGIAFDDGTSGRGLGGERGSGVNGNASAMEGSIGRSSANAYPLVTADSTASLEELTPIGPGAAAHFADRIKAAIRACQRPEALAASSARLRLPSAEELQAMIASLRARYVQ